MKTTSTFLTLLFISTISLAQYKNYKTENKNWYKGELYFADGLETKGQLRYNFVSDMVSIKSKSGTKNLGAKNVNYFYLLDSLGEKLEFYSLPLFLKDSGIKKKMFFEVIDVGENYAVLCKYYFSFEQKNMYNGQTDDLTSIFKHKVEQVSKEIYIVAGNEIYPYMSGEVDANKEVMLYIIDMDIHFGKSYKKELDENNGRKTVKKYKISDNKALSTISKYDKLEIREISKAKGWKLDALPDFLTAINYFMTQKKQ